MAEVTKIDRNCKQKPVNKQKAVLKVLVSKWDKNNDALIRVPVFVSNKS